MSSHVRSLTRRARVIFVACATAGSAAGFGGPGRAEVAYCDDLLRLTELARTKEKFGYIAGAPREGSFIATTLPLPGWRNCALYGTRTYTCDTESFPASGQAEEAVARIVAEITNCLGDGWTEDKSRSSPAYAVIHGARDALAMTVSTDVVDHDAHVVHLILFIR